MASWQPILAASLVSVVGALGALWLKEHLDRSSAVNTRRLEAYLRLAASSEVIALRSSVYNSSRSPVPVLGETLNGLMKFCLLMVMWAFPPMRRADAGFRQSLMDSIPTSRDLDPPMAASHLVDAMDELVHARVEVYLVGSPAVIAAADELLDASRNFMTVVENKSMWTSKSKAAIQIEAERERMLTAHRAFLAITRSEMKELRSTRRRRSRMTRGVRRTSANGDVLLTDPGRVEEQFGRLGPSDLT
jgi:hypothetical protein